MNCRNAARRQGLRPKTRQSGEKVRPAHAQMQVPTVYITTEINDIPGANHVEPVSAKELAVRMVERGCSLAYLKRSR